MEENKNLGYEELGLNSYEEFLQLEEDMSLCVKVMYSMIDKKEVEKYPSAFLYDFNEWNRLKKLLMRNPYNHVGHSLSKEIKDTHNAIIEKYKKELYYTF